MIGYQAVTGFSRLTLYLSGRNFLRPRTLSRVCGNGGLIFSKVSNFATKVDLGKRHYSLQSRRRCYERSLSNISANTTFLKPLNFLFSSSPAECRRFSKTQVVMERVTAEEVRKRVEDITDCFAEARELLGDARESLGSTYFSEDMTDAQSAVATTLTKYKALLADLDEDQRNDVTRTIGLRMEELKAQEQAIKDLLD